MLLHKYLKLKYHSTCSQYYNYTMSTLQERLAGARQKAGLTQSQLARNAGVSQSTIAQIESGRNSGSKFAFRLANALNVSVEWLMTGKGPAEIPSDTQIDVAYHFSRLREGESLNLTEPRLDPDNSDRVLYEFVQPGAALFDGSFFLRHQVDASDCRLVAVSGMDMEPYLFHGEWVLINTAEQKIMHGRIYAFLFAGHNLVVRQASWLPDRSLRLRMFRSPNETYDVLPDEIENLCVLGEVIYRSGPQLFDSKEFE